MPFKSELQSKACFATDGFDGKVDCKKWAKKTNYRNLPKKKMSFKEFIDYEPGVWELFAKIRAGDHSLIEPFKARFAKAHVYDQKRASMFVDAMRERIQRGATTDDWEELERELRHLMNSDIK